MEFDYLDTLIKADLEEPVDTSVEGYRHVWVIVEVNGQAFVPGSLAVLGQGRDIADQFGVYLFALLLGHKLANGLVESLGGFGADQVLLLDEPTLAHYQVERYTQVLAALTTQMRPEIVLLAATPLGNDLAPRLAQRLGTGLMSHCVQLGLDMAERQLLGTVSRKHGDYFHTLVCPQARPQIATLEPEAFRVPDKNASRTCLVEKIIPSLAGCSDRLIWVEMDTGVTRTERPLAEARIIVAAGRGLQDAVGFALVEQLAAAIGGSMAGSRGALDEGWIKREQQIGITGQEVKPDLYIACGISGAIQHCVGIQEARFVIAINKDENAPIMQIANVGAVGDVKKIIRALLEYLDS